LFEKNPELAICALARIRLVTPYPVASVLGNVFTNLLGRQTKGTDLRSQSRLSSDLTTSHTEVAIDAVSLCIERISEFWSLHDLHLIGVELGSCPTNKC